MQEVDSKQTDLTNAVKKNPNQTLEIYNYYYLIVGQLHEQPQSLTVLPTHGQKTSWKNVPFKNASRCQKLRVEEKRGAHRFRRHLTRSGLNDVAELAVSPARSLLLLGHAGHARRLGNATGAA